jgi:hypothetical protein
MSHDNIHLEPRTATVPNASPIDGSKTKTDAYTTTTTHAVHSRDATPTVAQRVTRDGEISPVRSHSDAGEINYKHVDGVGEQHGSTKLEKDSFSFVGVVSLAVSCINSWVVLVTALAAGLSSGGPTASACSALLPTIYRGQMPNQHESLPDSRRAECG